MIRKSYPIIWLVSKTKSKRNMHQLEKSDCGLIERKFVNTRAVLGLFMRNFPRS